MLVGQALREFRQVKNRARPALDSLITKNTNTQFLEPDQIPKNFVVEFRNDYDIHQVFKVVSSKIYHESKSFDILETKIRILRVQRSDARSLNECKDIDREIVKLENTIVEYANPARLQKFTEDAQILLTEYGKIPKPVIELDIMKGMKRSYRPDENDIARIGIIMQFIELCSKYIKIDCICSGYTKRDAELHCECCDTDISQIPASDDHRVICTCCGAENAASKIIYRGDAESSHVANINPKHRGYDNISNFKKALYRYLGRIKPKVDMVKLTQALDEYFSDCGLPIGAKVYEKPLDIRGHREDTSVSVMIDAFKAINYTQCYEDINYIMNQYWGWELPVLAPGLEDIILNDYRKTQKVWNKMPDSDKGRKSSIAAQYRLFKHLQLRGHICYSTDFKMPQPDSIQAYEKIWQKMCEECGDPDIYFIPT